MNGCHAACTLVTLALALATLALETPPSVESFAALAFVAFELARCVSVAVWRRRVDDSYGITLAGVVAVTLYVDAGARLPTLYAMLGAASLALTARFVRFCDGPRLLWRHYHRRELDGGVGDPPAAQSKYAVFVDD